MLKYLFTAEYEDGSSFVQSQDDVSKLDEKRSQFYDVIQSEKKLVKFYLRSDDKVFSVDLLTGYFNINGIETIVEGDKPVPINNPVYRLIFYRQHQHDFNAESKKETVHRVTYFIGWQTIVDGVNYQ